MRKINGDGVSKPVVDATESFTIHVATRDIQNALTGNDEECAIARCLLRRTNALKVSVGALTILIEHEDRYLRYQWSDEDARKIHDFDASGYMRPMAWTLMPPKPSRRLGAKAGKPSGSGVRNGTARNVTKNPPLRHVKY